VLRDRVRVSQSNWSQHSLYDIFRQHHINMAFAVARPAIGGKSTVAMTMAKKQREAFSFPVLPTSEIQSCLHEMGIAIDEGDLDKAKNEVVRNIYEQLIYECTGISKEELYTPRPCDDGAGGPIPRFEDLHDESIPTLHYMRAL
jgi:Nuf2 family